MTVSGPLMLILIGQCGNQLGHHLLTSYYQQILSGKPSQSQLLALSRFFRSNRPEIPLGNVLFSISAELEMSGAESYFDIRNEGCGFLVPRCIQLDTESKVIQQLHESVESLSLKNNPSLPMRWRYHSKNAIFKQTGAGNNWAHGYYRHAPEIYKQAKKQIEKEYQLCLDTGTEFGGFILVHSLAGGTGSGLGAWVTEQIRRDYPHALMMNVVVWPYSKGEVSVQHFNSLLTLSHVYPKSDAIICLRNDHLHQICADRFFIKSISFADLNYIAAQMLTQLLLPCKRIRKPEDISNHGALLTDQYMDCIALYDIICQLCPDPRFKLISLKVTPLMRSESLAYTNHQWNAISRHLLQMLITDAATDEKLNWSLQPRHQSLFRNIFSRGANDVNDGNHGNVNLRKLRNQLESAYHLMIASMVIGRQNPNDRKRYPDEISEKALDASLSDAGFRDGHLYASILKQFDYDTTIGFYSQFGCSDGDKMIVGACNSTGFLQLLIQTLSKAIKMYDIGAFLHSYTRFGATDDDFKFAFESVQCIIRDYASLTVD